METNVKRVGIENGRASFAFQEVKQAKERLRGSFENYRSYVKKMPSLIQVNGLGQALAFCFQKGKEYKMIYQSLAKWMKTQFPDQFSMKNQEFVEVVVNLSSADYRLWTMEAMALLDWMRKFADGMAKDDAKAEE
ncbi:MULTISPECIES: type III-B CRISPR module-associated protein Cmr5 [Geobacillus]|uniref:CRISPR type III-B/RAMP module-associated protein Cmr5 n=1 Tax=Geobacillus thermocatenulatus TaxID=33938 RepID=A0A226Q3W9_9BACL|nr:MULTISPECIES: type III-B CRISPR module-associated protein Cmr5 [Geobacillus]AST00690.1 type III-B CRISPR module-associated protein Cmr5 [Geobacillus thermocatenulatus]KLR75081.1 CRISPR-associated protein Cmr5 [Geobacillus sp. T6]KPC98382.1 CRISPR-associated protein [Geobacillus sp. BCO2]OXB87056.1 type III-B CRISPR module-associated protein Cmr5 [Geobacillus thermocatenulatus]